MGARPPTKPTRCLTLGGPVQGGRSPPTGARGFGKAQFWLSRPPPPQIQKSWPQALSDMLLWEDDPEFFHQVEQRGVPLAKFTGHAAFLTTVSEGDLLQWKTLI